MALAVPPTSSRPRVRARARLALSSPRVASAALLMVLISVAVAACGVDDAERPLSKREYIAQMNAHQRETSDLFARLATSTKDPKSADEHLAEFDRFIARIEALRPPSEWKD